MQHILKAEYKNYIDDIKQFYENVSISSLKKRVSKKETISLFNFITKLINKDALILDLGCGYGRISNLLASKGYKVEGIDISRKLITYAKKEAREKGLKIKYYVGDFLSYRFKKKFDVILCLWSTIFHFIKEEDRIKLLNKVYRILNKKGRFIVEFPYLNKKWLQWLEKHKRFSNKFLQFERIGKYEVPLYYLTVKQFKNEINKSKFTSFDLIKTKLGKKTRAMFILTK